jgi:propionate CoA-transferase
MPIDVALIRGTTADTEGNLVMDREALTLDSLAMAMAVRNCGGVVIAQVEQIAEAGSLDPRQVKVPGIFIGCVVQSRPENHVQTYATDYSPVYAGKVRAPMGSLDPMVLDERKIIARRAAMELKVNDVVNLGIGMPEGVANVAAEERILDLVTLTAEPGIIGGIPASGLNFGAATNPGAIVDQNQQFDFYDGGGLDIACLGLARCDQHGNINVSSFGPKLAGAGGFINISQNARKVVFAGTFNAGGLKVSSGDGKLEILNEGKTCKFVKEVEQISFCGGVASANNKPVLYVTERCVFELDERGLVLTEIAPGVDIQKDILDQMDFTPIVDNPVEMHAGIFHNDSMELLKLLSELTIPQRLNYDAVQKTLFINFENLHVRSSVQITEISNCVTDICRPLEQRVAAVVNYDGFEIDSLLVDEYASMVNLLVETYYASVRRYSTNAFLRMKLEEGTGTLQT